MSRVGLEGGSGGCGRGKASYECPGRAEPRIQPLTTVTHRTPGSTTLAISFIVKDTGQDEPSGETQGRALSLQSQGRSPTSTLGCLSAGKLQGFIGVSLCGCDGLNAGSSPLPEAGWSGRSQWLTAPGF